MLEILYYIFIFPVEQVLEWALFTLFKATKNYGISIILLSLIMQLFMLKLTFYFDKKAASFGALKAQCDSKIKEFKRVFKGAELQSYIRTLYKQRHFHPIFALFGLGGLALQIPFFIAMIHLVENAEYLQSVRFLWIDDLSKPDSIMLFGLSIHILPLLMTAFTLINVFYSSKELGARVQGSLIALLFLVLLYSMPSALVLYWTCNMAFALFKEIFKRRGNSSLSQDTGITESPIESQSTESTKPQGKLKTLLFNIFTPHAALDSKTYATYRKISILAILNICFIICVFSPYAIYSSDVSQFDISQTYQTLGALFGFFLISSFLLIYFTNFFYKTRLLKLGAWGVSVILCIGLVYTFILVGDYGVMDHFIFQKLNFANPDLRLKKYTYFLLTLCGAVIFLLFMMKWLKQIWSVLFATLFVVSGYYCVHIVYSIQDYVKYSRTQNIQDSNDIQPYEKELFSYSKTEKNIVVMVLDMFSGSHMHPLLEQFPEFKTQLDGFVLFDNAISTTGATIHSIATIIGGEHYAVYNVNARKENFSHSINKAFGVIGDAFVKNGYDVGYFMGKWSGSLRDIKVYNDNMTIVQNPSQYLSHYLDSNPLFKKEISDQLMLSHDQIKILLLQVGLFRFAPDFIFRARIYNDGAWLVGNKNLRDKLVSIAYASSFYAFTHLHNIESNKPTFKYLHSLMTHDPYALYYNQEGCAFHFDGKSVWKEYPHKDDMLYQSSILQTSQFQHYDTEACALSYLSDFVKWLQENEIYDNTQIFVVSDHGAYDPIRFSPYLLADGERYPDSLFLFKDFNASGELKLDSRLMANYDISSIFCENLPNGCLNVPKNILKNYPKQRELINTQPFSLLLSDTEINENIIRAYYKVKGSIYDDSNWQDITESVKNGTFKIDGIEH